LTRSLPPLILLVCRDSLLKLKHGHHVSFTVCTYMYKSFMQNTNYNRSFVYDIAAKYDISMNKFDKLNLLQTVNGALYKEHYNNIMACKEFISCIHQALCEDVKAALQAADFVAVLLDETTDNCNYKVLLVFIYYVKDGKVTERMLELKDLQGSGTAEAVYNAVNFILFDSYKIATSKIVFIGTDGASSMYAERGGFGGMFAKRLQPGVVRFHCAAHRLQLAVQDTFAVKVDKVDSNINADVTAGTSTTTETAIIADEELVQLKYGSEVAGFLDRFDTTLRLIYNYFGKSAKKTEEFKKVMDSMNSQYKEFKKLYNVRWLARREAINAVYTNFKGLLSYTLQMKDEQPNDVSISSLYEAVRDVRFIVALHLFVIIHEELGRNSEILQQNRVDASLLIETVEGATAKFEGAYIKPINRGLVGISEKLPGIKTFKEATTGIHVDKKGLYACHEILYPTSCVFQADKYTADASFFKAIATNVVLPLMQDLVESLKKRFPQDDLLKAFSIFDFKKLKKAVKTSDDEKLNCLYEKEIQLLAKHYKEQRTCEDGTIIEPIFAEFDDVENDWNSFVLWLKRPEAEIYETWQQLYNTDLHKRFGKVFKLVSMSLILPLSTAIVERGFSVMNAAIKNKLRNRLKVDMTNQLLNVSINGEDMFAMSMDGKTVLAPAVNDLLERAKKLFIAGENRRFLKS